VIVGAGNADVVGDSVNMAARLPQEAGASEVLVGESRAAEARALGGGRCRSSSTST
jgi:class 3 adenylate cyclase